VSHDELFVLSRYTLFPGVQVSGTVHMGDDGPPLVFAGAITFGGAGAAAGDALLRESGKLEGRFAGRLVTG
jgi:hypothetical protein